MKKRLLILFISLAMLFSFAVSAAADENNSDGYFVLTVCTANTMVIEPCRIDYTQGQSVRDALMNSGYEFTGLEQGFVSAVEGVTANYSILYDDGGYDLDVPASEITALRIGVTVTELPYYDGMLDLIRSAYSYLSMDNNVQNYPGAKSAYRNVLAGIRSNGESASALMEALNAAVAEYEVLLNGEKHTVHIEASQGGNILNNAYITLTDSYGNVSENIGNSIQVIEGKYSFSISDGGVNKTEGTVTVAEDMSLSVTLPSGEWFGEITAETYAITSTGGASFPYQVEQNTELHEAVIYVDDTAAGRTGVQLKVNQGAVPNERTTGLYAVFTSVLGDDYSGTNHGWNFKQNLKDIVAEGMEGRTFMLEARYKDDSGYTQIQSYKIHIVRIPTITEMTVSGGGISLPVDFTKSVYDYSLSVISDTIEINTVPFNAEYTVEGNGTVSLSGNETIHSVVVTAPSGESTTYTLHISKKDAVSVTLDLPEGTAVEVKNDAGAVIAPENGMYNLIPGERYTYTATKDRFYHTSESFYASEGMSLTVAEPVTRDWMTGFGAYSLKDSSGNRWIPYESDKPFSSGEHEYTFIVPDVNSMMRMQANVTEGVPYACYISQTSSASTNGLYREQEITYEVDPVGAADFMYYAVCVSGYGQHITISVRKTVNDILYYQDYLLNIVKQLHVTDLEVSDNGEPLVFIGENGNATEFDRDIADNTVSVNRDTETVAVSLTFPNEKSETNVDGGYYALINGVRYEDFKNIEIVLNTEIEEEVVNIKACHADETGIVSEYRLHIKKTDPVRVTISANPSDTVIYLTSDLSGKRIAADNGSFLLTPGATYSYSATRSGYIGIQGKYTAPSENAVFTVNLAAAPQNTGLVNLDARWPHLRLNNSNNGVINDRTPVTAEESVLYWAKSIGSGVDSSACSPPILVGGYLYVYAGNSIQKIDPLTGELVTSNTMDHTSSFAINPPTYADGMIFVGLSNGTVQAFNAVTLESLWIYRDPLGGQPDSSIVYHDGYVYTGFWTGEDQTANYVCLSATDEDPSQPKEEKIATWKYSSPGGFYWAGAFVNDDYLLVGTDDGESGYTSGRARLLSFDKKTGNLIDEYKMTVPGDIRSSITSYNGKYYFTCKGGYFFEASVDNEGNILNVRTLKLYNYSSRESNPPMSTSTPVIYNGRAYIGVAGVGQFNAYSGHNITVIDINSWEIAYTVKTQGYPQTSGVLTTAYESETGYVYVYFFDNMTPGKLRVLKDKPGLTSPSLITMEGSFETAYNLFQPVGEHAQYALCSPIVDEYGTIYFKNDSSYLMAVGSTVESLEISRMPDQTAYDVGDVFDGEGMRVTAHFSNGISRDVTEYVTWSTDTLTAEDTDFQISYPYVMYQNSNGMAGVEYPVPIAVLNLTIQEKVIYGDVNGDGEIDMVDVNIVYQYIVDETVVWTDRQFTAADVNGDGEIDMVDVNLIYAYIIEAIDDFPVQQ